MNKNKKLIISCIIVFIIALLFRIHFINLKQGLHGDEVFSINISNMSEYGWTKAFPDTFVTGKELKRLIFYNDTSVKDTLSDLKKLHKDNDDPPHTNLYYSVLRIWCTGFASTDLPAIIWRCCSLNLLFFCFSFFIMYKILRQLFKDNALIPFGLFVAFVNTGTISNTLFIRPYQLQETVFLLLTYVVIRFMEDIENNRFLTRKNFLTASVVLALTLLTGYLAPFYIGILGLVLIVKSVKSGQKQNIGFLFGAVGVSVFLAWLSYFSYFNGFVSYRAEETVTNFLEDYTFTAEKFIAVMLNFLYYVPCIVVCLIIAIRKFFAKIPFFQDNKRAAIIFGCAFLWIILVFPLMPFKMLRYVVPVFPLISILYVFFTAGFSKKEKYTYMIIFCLLMTILTLVPTPKETWGFQKERENESIINNDVVIENLFRYKELPQRAYIHEPNVPVYLIERPRYATTSIPKLNDNQLYWICYDKCNILQNLKEFYLYTDTYINLDSLKQKYNILYSEEAFPLIKLIHK